MPFFDTISLGFTWNSYRFCFPEGIAVQEVYGRVCPSECTFDRIQLSPKCMESSPPHAATAEESMSQFSS